MNQPGRCFPNVAREPRSEALARKTGVSSLTLRVTRDPLLAFRAQSDQGRLCAIETYLDPPPQLTFLLGR